MWEDVLKQLTSVEPAFIYGFLSGVAIGIFAKFAIRWLAVATVLVVIFHLWRAAGAL